MKTKLLLSATAALVLSACAVTDDHHGHDHDRHAPRVEHEYRHDDVRHDDTDRRSDRARSTRYSCRNGLSVNIHRINADRIELRLDDKRTVMTSARSGSGELYVSERGLFGTGAQWHQKRGTAVFEFKDPYGNQVQTTCNAS